MQGFGKISKLRGNPKFIAFVPRTSGAFQVLCILSYF